MMVNLSNHPWAHRIRASNDFDRDDFVYRWLHDWDEIDLSRPALSITNGWQSRHMENKWFADELHPQLSVFSYDSRGQGDSIKEGDLDAIQGAIDANHLVSAAFDEFDRRARDQGIEPGKKILQGNCIGTMTIAALFAGKFPLADRTAGTILISPVSTFDLPLVAKAGYFLPEWLGGWVVRYLAEPLAEMIVSGEESEFSRKQALKRVYSLDMAAAIKQARQVFWKENVEKLWSSIDVPSLMLVSRNDPLTELEESAEVYRRLQYPIWVELEAADHLLLEDNIKFVRGLVADFGDDPWQVYEEYKNNGP